MNDSLRFLFHFGKENTITVIFMYSLFFLFCEVILRTQTASTVVRGTFQFIPL